jgi:dethiobiotin synthetase
MTGQTIVVTGTDTDVGKTVFAAALAGALNAFYWKPVQAGFDPYPGDKGEAIGDKETVARLSALPPDRILPEAYRLTTPCSPHQSAEIDGVSIDPARLDLPAVHGPFVVEGAGGALVPVTRDLLFADLFARWRAPVVLVSRTALGTINHSLLSIEALRSRGIPLLGIAFVGEANEDSESTISAMGRIKRLGRLPLIPHLDAVSLRDAFSANCISADFIK